MAFVSRNCPKDTGEHMSGKLGTPVRE